MNMNTTTDNNQATLTMGTQSGKLLWEPSEILEANFMFPVSYGETSHECFEDLEGLLAMPEELFSDIIIGLLLQCSLSDLEKIGMMNTVKSQNRLRILYHTLVVVDRHCAVVNETQTIIKPDFENLESQEGRGYQNVTPHPTRTDNEIAVYELERLEQMDNQIPSQNESNLAILSQR